MHNKLTKVGILRQHDGTKRLRKCEYVSVLPTRSNILRQDDVMAIQPQSLNNAMRYVLVNQEFHEAAGAPNISAA